MLSNALLSLALWFKTPRSSQVWPTKSVGTIETYATQHSALIGSIKLNVLQFKRMGIEKAMSFDYRYVVEGRSVTA
jgi:hypothetical protein